MTDTINQIESKKIIIDKDYFDNIFPNNGLLTLI
jgi:hypothetical protein